jgi:O-methyltransferase
MTSILGDRKLGAISALLATIADMPGALAECGVYRGGTLRLMAERHPDRTIYGFDTFTGLPVESWSEVEVHSAGDFGDTTMQLVQDGIAGLERVFLLPGIFPASAAKLEATRFAFVHIDFDFYASTAAAIEWFLPRMSPGGVMVFDDYRWPHCPGVEQAINEAGLTVEMTVEYQAFWRAP